MIVSIAVIVIGVATIVNTWCIIRLNQKLDEVMTERLRRKLR